MDINAPSIPSLEITTLMKLCVESAASSVVWRRQKHIIQRLSEPLSSIVFHHLLCHGCITPATLQMFQLCVSELYFNSFYMRSSVDSTWLTYIGEYVHLSVLVLDGCTSVTSHSLSDLQKCSALRKLHVNQCPKITDAAIPYLLRIKSLNDLGISETSVTSKGVSFLGQLTNLTSIHLGGLRVNDLALLSLRGLSHLQHLDVWGTDITDASIDSLKSFPLASLNVGWTAVSHLPAALVKSLESLNMSLCTAVPLNNMCTDVGQTWGLTRLDLRGSKLEPSKAIAEQDLVQMPLLHVVDLARSNVDALNFLQASAQLTHVDISETALCDSDLHQLAKVGQQIRHLSIAHARVSSRGVAHLAGHCPELEHLNMEGTAVDSSLLPLLTQFPKLKLIILKDTRVTGTLGGQEAMADPDLTATGLHCLSSLQHLQSLDLRGVDMGEVEFHQLSSLIHLQRLKLSGSGIIDSSLPWLRALKWLRHLEVTDAMITRLDDLEALAKCGRLEVLDLQGCFLLTAESVHFFTRKHPRVTLKHKSIPRFDDRAASRSSTSSWQLESSAATAHPQIIVRDDYIGRAGCGAELWKDFSAGPDISGRNERKIKSGQSSNKSPDRSITGLPLGRDGRIRYSRECLLRLRGMVSTDMSGKIQSEIRMKF